VSARDLQDLLRTINQAALRELLANALESLTSRERIVLQLRFGLADGEFRTLDEVGKVLSLTRERIRQIEQQAVKKLRRSKCRRSLLDFLGGTDEFAGSDAGYRDRR
jgi:RNA polymerase primary sigma factor